MFVFYSLEKLMVEEKKYLQLELDENLTATLIPLDDLDVFDSPEAVKLRAERTERLKMVCKDVQQLKELFQDINSLVVADDENIAHVAENISEVRRQVEKAEVELVAVVPLQKSANQRELLLTGMVLSLVAGPVAIALGIKAAGVLVITFVGAGAARLLYMAGHHEKEAVPSAITERT